MDCVRREKSVMNELYELYNSLANNTGFRFLLVFILLDLVSGYSKAFVGKKINSTVDAQGWAKRINLLFGIISLYPFSLISSEFTATWYGILLGGLVMTIVSVTENWTALGLPMFQVVKDRLSDEKIKLIVDKKIEEAE